MSDSAEEAAKAVLSTNLGINMGSYILGTLPLSFLYAIAECCIGLWLDAVLFGVMIQQLINWATYATTERWVIRFIVVIFNSSAMVIRSSSKGVVLDNNVQCNLYRLVSSSLPFSCIQD
jgi:hypothetical protein